MITKDLLRELLDYNQETGFFHWKKRVSMSVCAGSAAGTTDGNGYTVIKLKSVRYLAHRLAWIYVNGEWPSQMIDHIGAMLALAPTFYTHFA